MSYLTSGVAALIIECQLYPGDAEGLDAGIDRVRRIHASLEGFTLYAENSEGRECRYQYVHPTDDELERAIDRAREIDAAATERAGT